MRRPRLVLADDHTLIVHGLRRMLEPDCDVVGIASDGRSLVDLVQKTHPDLVLLDINMPLLNGIDAARQIRKSWPAIKIAFLTMHADRDYVIEAFRAGASAYLLKSSAEDELLNAIRKVLAGKVYVTSALAPELRTLHLQQAHTREPAESALTVREREVLQVVLTCSTNFYKLFAHKPKSPLTNNLEIYRGRGPMGSGRRKESGLSVACGPVVRGSLSGRQDASAKSSRLNNS